MSMPERIWATDDLRRWYRSNIGGDTEYIRSDFYEAIRSELTNLAIESKNRELKLARLEGEVNALRKLCADKSCNHAWDREWRDDRTGRIYRNCVICGVKVEMP